MIPEILATLICGVFAGAAIYVNLVEQPARLSCGIKLAVTEWRPSYKRGALMQAPLAVIGSLLAFLSWWIDRGSAWLIGGILLLAVVPFTLIVIFPTNKLLDSDELEPIAPPEPAEPVKGTRSPVSAEPEVGSPEWVAASWKKLKAETGDVGAMWRTKVDIS